MGVEIDDDHTGSEDRYLRYSLPKSALMRRRKGSSVSVTRPSSLHDLQEAKENVACSFTLDPVVLLVAIYYETIDRQMPQPKRKK